MKLHEPQHRAPTPSPSMLSFSSEFINLPLLILMILGQPAGAQQPETATVTSRSPLTAEQVVQNLVQMNLFRVRALRTYQGTRTYRAEYHGFPGARSAEMVVKVSYFSPAEKEFIVQSTTGSALIIDRVFKKLLEADLESVNDDHGQPLAAHLSRLPMTVAQHKTSSAGCGRFHLDKLAFRFGERIRARQDVANDGLQMAAAQETRRHKGSHPR